MRKGKSTVRTLIEREEIRQLISNFWHTPGVGECDLQEWVVLVSMIAPDTLLVDDFQFQDRTTFFEESLVTRKTSDT